MPLSTTTSFEYVRVLICYDLINDKRRAKLVKCLEDYGTRVQYSVFEALLTKRNFEILKLKVQKILDLDEDCINFYPLDSYSEKHIERLGTCKYEAPTIENFLIM